MEVLQLHGMQPGLVGVAYGRGRGTLMELPGGVAMGGGSLLPTPRARVTGWRSLARRKLPQTTTITTTTTGTADATTTPTTTTPRGP